MTERTPRFELRVGRFGAYFHDRERGGPNGFDLPLDLVLEKLNRIEGYKARLLAQAHGEKADKP